MAVDRGRKGALLIVAVLAMVLCLVPGMALAVSDTSGSNYQTVGVTGFNVDVVADGSLYGVNLTDYQNSVNGYIDNNDEGGGHTFYSGLSDDCLPDDGRITLDTGMTFRLGDYSDKNALQLNATEEGTLNLVVPRYECKTVAILCAAAGISNESCARLVVTPLYGSDRKPAIDENENDISQTVEIPDWGRMPVTDRNLTYNRIKVTAGDGQGTSESGFALRVAEGIVVDSSKELTAIRFKNTGDEKATIFAVSALLDHDWRYAAFGSTITATCDNTSCSVLTNPTLGIVAPTLTVEGGEGSAKATVEANGTWTASNGLPSIPKVVYWSGETKLNEVPTTVGSYRAEITVEGVTAKLEYTIKEKTPAVVTKSPEAKSLIDDGDAQELVTAGEATGGTMKYALGSDATNAPVDGWDTAVPTGTDAGTYYVWYGVEGDRNHLDSDTFGPVVVAIVEIHEVTFDSRGGSPVPSQTVYDGATAAKPADPTRDGYAFDAWCSDEALGVAYDFSTPVTSDLTLYARWHLANAVIDGKVEAGPGAPATSCANVDEVASSLVETILDDPKDARLSESEKQAVKDGTEVDLLLKTRAVPERSAAFNEAQSATSSFLSSRGAMLGACLDISAWLQVAGFDPHAIADTGDEIELEVQVPERLRLGVPVGKTRWFFLGRIHGDQVSMIGKFTKGNTVSGRSSLFSTYFIAYTDKGGADPEPEPVLPVTFRRDSGGSGTYGGTSAEWTRLAGTSRYATMAAVVSEGFPSCDRVVLASGESFPDALCASALAGSWGCPVVLTSKVSLSPEAKAEVERLGAGDVVVFGGEATVSASVEAEVQAMGKYVERVAGDDRAATSVLALQRLVAGGASSDTVVVATGSTYADALSIGPWAYATKAPIVLLSGDALSDEAVAAIREGGFKRAVIVGGEGSVPASVESQLEGLSVTRLSGADRYATSVVVSEFAAVNGLSWSKVYVVSGESFPDALAGAPLAVKNKGVLLLTRDGSSAAAHAVASHASAISRGYVLGGEASVSAAMLESLREATR